MFYNEPMSVPVLVTKLYIPPTSSKTVLRPRLIEQLNNNLFSDHKLTLISAPAGFGKTTLLAQWLTQSEYAAAWVSLEAADNEPFRFMTYFVAAVRSLFPTSCEETFHTLQLPQPISHTLIEAILLNDLGELPDEAILVLDDFDRITDPVLLEFFTHLVEHLPRNLHLVLSGRADPPLPLAKWRGQGRLFELRAVNLSATRQETVEIVTPIIGKSIQSQILEELHTSTEGWLVGLHMAALSLEHHNNAADFMASFKRHGGRAAREFLEAEVFAVQPPPVQGFLLNTSILTRVSPSLAAALLGEPVTEKAGVLLNQVVRANLFLNPLDQQGEWYAYHALFSEMLQRELQARFTTSHINTLHRRASAWFAAHNFMEEAIQHALAGHDLDRAAELVQANIYPHLNREDWRALEQDLGLLPEELIQRYPRLLMARAWTLNEYQRLSAIPPLVARVQALMPDQDEKTRRLLRGEMATLQSQNLYLENRSGEGLALARAALDDLPPEGEYIRSLAVAFYTLHLYQLEGMRPARDFCIETLEREAVPTAVSMRALLGLCHIYRQSNLLNEAKRAAERMLYVGQQKTFVIAETWAHYVLGNVAYVRNELSAAREHFMFVSEQRYHSTALCVSDSLIGLGLVYLAQNRREEAEETVQDLYDSATATGSRLYTQAAESLRVCLDLAHGDPVNASRPFSKQPVPMAPFWLSLPAPLIEARVMVSSPDRTTLRQALKHLAALYEFATNTHSEWHLIEILALQAVAYENLGEKQKALDLVGRSLALAEPARAVRVFVDLGTAMAQLVSAYAARTSRKPFMLQLLEALGTSVSPEPVEQYPPLAPEVDEQLHPREIEILHYLERRYTASEIAQALVISSWTVRTHIRNIYRKLKVNNRATAVAQAQALGLLSRD